MTARTRPGDDGYKRYLTSKQLEQLRLALFTQAAQSMGKRLEQLKADETKENSEAIQAIRSEWVVDG